MRQLLLLPALVCSSLLLTGALDRQALFSDTSSAAFVPRGPETEAGPLLDRIIAAFAPERVRWLDMNLWQKMDADEPYEAEGRYVVGPNQHLHLEMTVTVAGKTGHVLVVSDDLTLQETHWADREPSTPVVTPLPQKAEIGDPAVLARARQSLLDSRGYGGVPQLMKRVRAGLVAPRQQGGTWHNHPVIKLTGAWNAEEDLLKTLPACLRARQCNLILDAQTLWPFRIEWIGSPRLGDHAVILLQMEFRSPVVNRPLPEDECARLFRFPQLPSGRGEAATRSQ